jgi:hypothetical protein
LLVDQREAFQDALRYRFFDTIEARSTPTARADRSSFIVSSLVEWSSSFIVV